MKPGGIIFLVGSLSPTGVESAKDHSDGRMETAKAAQNHHSVQLLAVSLRLSEILKEKSTTLLASINKKIAIFFLKDFPSSLNSNSSSTDLKSIALPTELCCCC